MKVHELKCWPEPFEAIWRGVKTFEVRIDDRDPGFYVGDFLWLREFDPGKVPQLTGREIHAFVPYLLGGQTDMWRIHVDAEGGRSGNAVVMALDVRRRVGQGGF